MSSWFGAGATDNGKPARRKLAEDEPIGPYAVDESAPPEGAPHHCTLCRERQLSKDGTQPAAPSTGSPTAEAVPKGPWSP